MADQKADIDKAYAEVRAKLSPLEERFERLRNTIGLFLGPLLALFLYLMPMPSLSDKAHRLAAMIGWVVTWWVTEPIPLPVTALLGAVLCIVCGVAPAKTVCAPFADPIVFLFLGSFILAEAMAVHGLDRRFAFRILSFKWVHSTGRILLVFGAIAAGLSAWMSNTAVTAMMLPIGLGIIYAMGEIMEQQAGEKLDPRWVQYGTGMMLMAAYASSVGGIATPVGTPPNLIGIAMIENLVKVKIPFFQWMLFAVPIMVVMFVALFMLLYFFHKPQVTHFKGNQRYLQRECEKHGRWKRGEKNALTAFLITVTLWIFPGCLAVVCGTGAPIYKTYSELMPEAVAALVGAGLLFILPVDWEKREFTLSWRQAQKIDWGTLILFGGGLALGNLMFETRLAETVGAGIFNVSGATSLWGITLVAIVIAKLVTEVTSNTAAATMVVPVVISLAVAAHVNPIPPALGATLSAGLAFILPVSTPPNAIIYSSGMVPITRMIRAGIVFDIVSMGIIWVGLRILLPLIGLG